MTKIYFDEAYLNRHVVQYLKNAIINLNNVINTTTSMSFPDNFAYRDYVKNTVDYNRKNKNRCKNIDSIISTTNRALNNNISTLNSKVLNTSFPSIKPNESLIK